jgi:hypothetical protein
MARGPDGLPHAFEIEHASGRPDLVAPAFGASHGQGFRRPSGTQTPKGP